MQGDVLRLHVKTAAFYKRDFSILRSWYSQEALEQVPPNTCVVLHSGGTRMKTKSKRSEGE